MKKYNKILVLLAMLFCTIGLISFNNKQVKANYLDGNAYTEGCTRYVKVIKPVKVYKVKTGNCEAKNHFKYYDKLKKIVTFGFHVG